MLLSKIYPGIHDLFAYAMQTLRTFIDGFTKGKGTGSGELDDALNTAGYAYDSRQDIFYSVMNPWQRSVGYCRLYDEAAAPMGMIIDCEPVYFEYGGKRWMVELWKGQYDLTTGCEIGVYTTEHPDLSIPGIFNGTFYSCASNADSLYMSYTLKKNGVTLFSREGRHWWLTGFKLGAFSEPSELTVDISITLKDEAMCSAFVQGLKAAGYLEHEIAVSKNSVSLKFAKPRTQQPATRTPETDWIIQRKNEHMCSTYMDVTRPYSSMEDKVKAIEEQAPELYDVVINVGKARLLYKMYETLKNYVN